MSRSGRLYEANHGTLYLHHIAEAPSRVQARLARVLRDREATLVETGATIALDVRPIAAVDLSFDIAVKEGRVRDDLFRRLSVIRIDVPPLRNRREDIPALANYFLRDICASLRVPPKTLSRPALSILSALPWRGNAGELRSLLETIVSAAEGGRGIGLEDVLAHVRLDGGAVIFPHERHVAAGACALRARLHRSRSSSSIRAASAKRPKRSAFSEPTCIGRCARCASLTIGDTPELPLRQRLDRAIDVHG